MRRGTPLAPVFRMVEELKQRIRFYARENGDQAHFADEILRSIALIEREFTGEQREGLLRLAAETLERHIQIQENSAQVRTALARLEAYAQWMRQLCDFITATPGDEKLH